VTVSEAADGTRREAAVRVLGELLPVLDDLERAIVHATSSAEGGSLVEGVQLVQRQFLAALGRLDVVPIEAEGQLFDPALHEAISRQESDQPSGTVVQVLRRGYKLGGRLLRPARVVVAGTKNPG
jgi:molecular chaperone GrpE